MSVAFALIEGHPELSQRINSAPPACEGHGIGPSPSPPQEPN